MEELQIEGEIQGEVEPIRTFKTIEDLQDMGVNASVCFPLVGHGSLV